MQSAISDDIARVLGSPVTATRPLSGGDINDAYAVTLDDGRRIFVKANSRAPADMFEVEALGLALLARGPLTVPDVIAVGERWLALELLESPARRAAFAEELGRGLAALHRISDGTFGLDHDNYIGRLPQSNAAADDWATFYRRERLEPQLAMAARSGHIDATLRVRFDRLFDQLPNIVGPSEAPALLHGDLWGGNLHVDAQGAPCLIDPAVYRGHREMDLAMMRLFGGFGAVVFDAYDEAYPLAPDHERRVGLYQLYPLLVHVNLFGRSYLGAVSEALSPWA